VNLKDAVAIAKQRVAELCAPQIPQNMRLENFLYDDHLAVWSLTIGFALPGTAEARSLKLVPVSEAHKDVLSVDDR
jgi:hypothetical protein